MFHPLPPTLGPGVYLGSVERATSFIRDDLWYGIFAGLNPGQFSTSIFIFPIKLPLFANKILLRKDLINYFPDCFCLFFVGCSELSVMTH